MAYSDEQIIDALQKTEGNQAAAARAVNCSRQTVWQRIQDSDKVKAEYDSINEASIDKAENKLMELVNSDDHRDHFKAIRFFLRTKARHRGFGDRMDITSDGKRITGSPIIVNSQGEMPDVE